MRSCPPHRREEDVTLTTLTHLALILVYICVLVIKTCELSSDACRSYGFGASAEGFFLFLLFFGLSVLVFQVAIEVVATAWNVHMRKELRRLRYRGGGFVELLPVTQEEFAHLPGLEPSRSYHLFLSHAWPIGQDVCKLIKQRCREICPSLHVFLDVEDLSRGSGTNEVDHSRCILVFAMPVYFEKINCVKELTRAIVRHKQITLLLPDAEVHGQFTQEMIREIVTGGWVHKWRFEKKLAEWASDWDVAEIKTPTAAEICNGLFKQPSLEWSRFTPFQDRTMVLMCARMLPTAARPNVYLQGASSFKLPRSHVTVKLYCSSHNPGAREIVDELNEIWPGLLQDSESLADICLCDHMLVYLNAATWTSAPELLAAEIREAQKVGLHLQLCHEFPSALDPGSARHAIEFKQIMDATPADLKKWPTNIYSQIAIMLKGGELREPGLANLAARLSVRVAATPVNVLLSRRSTWKRRSTWSPIEAMRLRRLTWKRSERKWSSDPVESTRVRKRYEAHNKRRSTWDSAWKSPSSKSPSWKSASWKSASWKSASWKSPSSCKDLNVMVRVGGAYDDGNNANVPSATCTVHNH